MNATQIEEFVASIMEEEPLSITHQTFGHNSLTFDVALSKRHVIVRTNDNPQVFASTEHNLAILSELGLPVPHILAVDLTKKRVPFAYLILTKIPGRDLRYELAAMTGKQMTRLAEQIVSFQRRVMTLPQGIGYGYAGIGEKGPYASWQELLQSSANNETALRAGSMARKWQARVEGAAQRYESYFRSISPACFLDDITVKNVIIENGELQGLIDFDCVCYGDPLYWLALTATGIVSDVGTRELFYADELKRLWKLTGEEEQVLAYYSASMALDFLRRAAATETPAWNARMLQAVAQWMRTASPSRKS